MAAGTKHCLAYTIEGKLYAWGRIPEGCLGYLNEEEIDDEFNERYQAAPKMVEDLKDYDVRKAVAGERYSMCLTNTGRVFIWGKGATEMKDENA